MFWCRSIHFFKKIIVQDAELAKPIQYTEKVSKFTLQDFEKMFAKQDLKITEVFGDYSFNKYDPENSQRLVIIASLK